MTMTLKTLPTASKEEVFWNAVDILTSQSGFSAGEGGHCMYRDGKGNRCGAGTVFSDEEYDPRWEGKVWQHVVYDYKIPDNHAKLLRSIQKVHDSLANHHADKETMPTPEEWHMEFEHIAKEYGIDYPPI